MPYRPYPDRGRTLAHLRRQQALYGRGPFPRQVIQLTGARERLLAKAQAVTELSKRWHPGAMARRIAKMTDQQVLAALAMTDEDIAAARAEADDDFRYAPPTGDGPVRLWDHVNMG